MPLQSSKTISLPLHHTQRNISTPNNSIPAPQPLYSPSSSNPPHMSPAHTSTSSMVERALFEKVQKPDMLVVRHKTPAMFIVKVYLPTWPSAVNLESLSPTKLILSPLIGDFRKILNPYRYKVAATCRRQPQLKLNRLYNSHYFSPKLNLSSNCRMYG